MDASVVQHGAVYRVVEIQGQGYGYMTPEDYAAVPSGFRLLVRVIQQCATEAEAQERAKALSSEWVDSVHRVRVSVA